MAPGFCIAARGWTTKRRGAPVLPCRTLSLLPGAPDRGLRQRGRSALLRRLGRVGKSVDRMWKYPRTPHLAGSGLQPGDEDLPVAGFEALEGRHLVVEEKLDGANSAISFTS